MSEINYNFVSENTNISGSSHPWHNQWMTYDLWSYDDLHSFCVWYDFEHLYDMSTLIFNDLHSMFFAKNCFDSPSNRLTVVNGMIYDHQIITCIYHRLDIPSRFSVRVFSIMVILISEYKRNSFWMNDINM